MDKKLIAKILIIVSCFVGSGLVLYFGYFKSSAVPAPQVGAVQKNPASIGGLPGSNTQPPDLGVSAITGQDVLPKGESLNFEQVINTSRFNYNINPYPQVDPAREIGIPVENLILPKPSN
jgi:hypothetical protein